MEEVIVDLNKQILILYTKLKSANKDVENYSNLYQVN